MGEPVTGQGTPGEPGGPEPARGRPASTSRRDVARVALELFNRNGYDETTVDQIASAVGISRRTFFRYYESKPDVVWGEFDAELGRLADRLAESADGEPLMDVLRRSVIATNRFSAGELDELRIRIGLITTVPSLVAHSAVRYEAWCAVVAGFAASRLGGSPDDLGPQVVARASLGAAMAAFACWSQEDGDDLGEEVDRAFRLLAAGFDERRIGPDGPG